MAIRLLSDSSCSLERIHNSTSTAHSNALHYHSMCFSLHNNKSLAAAQAENVGTISSPLQAIYLYQNCAMKMPKKLSPATGPVPTCQAWPIEQRPGSRKIIYSMAQDKNEMHDLRTCRTFPLEISKQASSFLFTMHCLSEVAQCITELIIKLVSHLSVNSSLKVLTPM